MLGYISRGRKHIEILLMVLCLGSIVNKDLFTRIHFHGLEKMGNIFNIKILNFCTLCAIMMVIFML